MRVSLVIKVLSAMLAFGLTIHLSVRYWENVRESGYIAFNTGEYERARGDLSFIAQMGDARAQKLMMRISGLGLAGPVDFAEAMRWMQRLAPSGLGSARVVGDQAHFIGDEAANGLYGPEKVELGKLWLQIAAASGYSRQEQSEGN